MKKILLLFVLVLASSTFTSVYAFDGIIVPHQADDDAVIELNHVDAKEFFYREYETPNNDGPADWIYHYDDGTRFVYKWGGPDVHFCQDGLGWRRCPQA